MFVYRCVSEHKCSCAGVWVYLDVCIQVRGFTWMFVYRCVSEHGCSYTDVWVYMDVRIQVCGITWMSIYKCVGLLGCSYGQTYTSMWVCVGVKRGGGDAGMLWGWVCACAACVRVGVGG